MTRLYQKLKSKNIRFHHVCEVGVYVPATSNILDFIRDGVQTTLVEADPEVAQEIERTFATAPNVQLHAVAVWDSDGTLKLSKAASSTFATDLPTSPALENDAYQISEARTFEVPCVRFSTLDDGTIDLLSIDIEGGEWYVLKHLRSRPKVLSLETHGKYYTNPFLTQIAEWLRANGYELWYKDGSDSVYIQQSLFPIGLADKFETWLAESAIRWKKFKRLFKAKRPA